MAAQRPPVPTEDLCALCPAADRAQSTRWYPLLTCGLEGQSLRVCNAHYKSLQREAKRPAAAATAADPASAAAADGAAMTHACIAKTNTTSRSDSNVDTFVPCSRAATEGATAEDAAALSRYAMVTERPLSLPNTGVIRSLLRQHKPLYFCKMHFNHAKNARRYTEYDDAAPFSASAAPAAAATAEEQAAGAGAAASPMVSLELLASAASPPASASSAAPYKNRWKKVPRMLPLQATPARVAGGAPMRRDVQRSAANAADRCAC